MADHPSYYPNSSDPNRPTPPPPQGFSFPLPPPPNPGSSSSPYQQQQQHPQPWHQQQQQHQQHPQQPSPYYQPGQSVYAGPPQSMSAPPPGSAPSDHQPDSGLAAQMAGMSLGGGGGGGEDPSAAAGAARKKKKDRHAYHTMEPAAMSQPFRPGVPQPPPGPHGAAFLNPDAPGLFPAGAASPALGAQFFPAATAAQISPAEFAARGSSAPVDMTGGAGSVMAAPGTRLSPDDLPSVPISRDAPRLHYQANVYPTMERHHPPPATVSYVAFDQAISSPKFARLTINNIPATSEALASTAIPLGLLLQPLAPLAPGEREIPVLDFGEAGPPRCRRCRAYVNPFIMFRSGGNRFVCNLCTYPNDTPPEYFCATGPEGLRIDRDQRPELTRGTVEFVVPKEYWTREPTALRCLFLIDVTQESCNRGFLAAFCDAILGALYPDVPDRPEDGDKDDGNAAGTLPEGSKVGFVTFDKDIHFYNVNSDLEAAHMMIMPDLEDPFVPLSDGLFVDPYESKSIITSLLTRLPAMFAAVKNPEPALLATINAAVAALERTGGKIICSLAALPTWGPGRLHMRDDGKHPGGEIDKALFTTELAPWLKAADKMLASGIGTDLFLAAPTGGYLDVATVGHLSSTTGGETFYYPNFVAPRDRPRLALEVRHTLTRETGFQALVKIRCSTGLQIGSYHGNFIERMFGADLELGVIDADKAIAVSFSHDGRLDPKLDAHFQSALLYTTTSGQRRVRCCNVVAGVSESTHECIKFADQDAIYCLLAKEAATRFGHTSANLADTRAWLADRTISILAAHRRNFAQPAPPNQLVMPDRLKELAMYMLGLVKTRCFKGGIETADRRVHELRMLRAAGAVELSLYLYPRMIAIHNLRPEEGFADEKTGHLCLPPSMGASFGRVEPGGAYLIDNGQQCILWLHSQTSPNLLRDLFGEDKTSLPDLDPYATWPPALPTHLNAQVRNILEWMRTMRGSKGLTVQLARQGFDGAEFEFARMLVEDRNNEAQSYVDWLVHLHKSVQMELAGHRKREDGAAGGDGSALSAFAGLRPPYW